VAVRAWGDPAFDLKGTGTFTETHELDYQGAGAGFITLIGAMHID